MGYRSLDVNKKIIFRCDGGYIQEIGLGHVVRCLLLARELKKTPNTEILFLMRESREAMDHVMRAGFDVKIIAEGEDEGLITLRTMGEFNPDIFVIDHLQNDAAYLSLVKKTGVILITIDDWSEGRRLADITINPIFHTGDSLYEGYDYMVLPPVPEDEVIPLKNGSVKNVFVSFGGFDSSDITDRFLASLHPAAENPQYHIIVSQLYKNFQEIKNRYGSRKDIKLYQDPSNYLALLHQADVAIVSGGLTMFHAAASGVPSLVISQYEHQADNARRLQEHGAVDYMGKAQELDFSHLMPRLQQIKTDNEKRRQMAAMGRLLIDGLGIDRVSEVIGIVNRLDWDSEFFHHNIACLYPKRIRENILKFALAKCKEDNIECLYYLCDCHDPESVRLVEKYRFHFVDIRLTYGRDLQSKLPTKDEPVPIGCQLREARAEDSAVLEKISENTYVHSRYTFDRHFSKDACRRFYMDWIAKSLRRGSKDIVFVSEVKGEVVGYVSCSKVSNNCGRIGLLGITEAFKNSGVGTALLQKCWEWCETNDLPLIEAVTQGRNIEAQRLYQSCGFRSKKTELWYHKWFGDTYDA